MYNSLIKEIMQIKNQYNIWVDILQKKMNGR